MPTLHLLRRFDRVEALMEWEMEQIQVVTPLLRRIRTKDVMLHLRLHIPVHQLLMDQCYQILEQWPLRDTQLAS